MIVNVIVEAKRKTATGDAINEERVITNGKVIVEKKEIMMERVITNGKVIMMERATTNGKVITMEREIMMERKIIMEREITNGKVIDAKREVIITVKRGMMIIASVSPSLFCLPLIAIRGVKFLVIAKMLLRKIGRLYKIKLIRDYIYLIVGNLRNAMIM